MTRPYSAMTVIVENGSKLEITRIPKCLEVSIETEHEEPGLFREVVSPRRPLEMKATAHYLEASGTDGALCVSVIKTNDPNQDQTNLLYLALREVSHGSIYYSDMELAGMVALKLKAFGLKVVPDEGFGDMNG